MWHRIVNGDKKQTYFENSQQKNHGLMTGHHQLRLQDHIESARRECWVSGETRNIDVPRAPETW